MSLLSQIQMRAPTETDLLPRSTEILRELAEDIGVPQSEKVSVECMPQLFSLHPHSTFLADRYIFKIPALYLIDLQTIPEELQVQNSEDPRLEDLAFIQQWADWISETMSVRNIRVTAEHKYILKTHLKMLEDPLKAKEALRFLLIRKFAHLKQSTIWKRLCIHAGTLGVFLLAILSTFLLCSTGLYWPIILFYNFVTAAALSILSISYVSLRTEKSCDYYALQKAPHCARGAIHFFEKMCELNKTLRQAGDLPVMQRFWYRFVVAPGGDRDIYLVTTGSEQERIERITSFFSSLAPQSRD